MIKYEWRTELSAGESDELADLLDRAARHDARAEHTTIAFQAVRSDMDGARESVRHLVIWMLPHAVALDRHDEPEQIAGLVRLDFGLGVSDGEAEVSVVVDPRFRSRGVITLFLEQAGIDLDGEQGWLGSGAHTLSAWARGNHPAAGRLSKRFLIPPDQRVWKLFRPLGADDQARANGAGSYVLSVEPAVSEEFGNYLTIEKITPASEGDSQAYRYLLDAAAATATGSGARAVAIHIDASNRALLHACRLTGFQHDRTDVRYQIGGRR